MNYLKWLTCLLLFALLPHAFANSPVGEWITIDDKTGDKRALVRLVVVDNKLTGTIVRVYPQPGDTGICSKCPGRFKDKPIKGLQFLWNLTGQGHGIWDGGEILEAKTGKIYSAKLRLKGNKLYVRGFVGIAILGRTQVWVRA